MTSRTDETRVFIAALIGGQAGAMFGLVFFGGMLFVPLLTALAGSAAGPLWLVGRERVRRRVSAAYARAALRS